MTRRSSRGNQRLSHLAPDARAQLTSQLHHVSLARGQVIFHAHEPLRTAYFPGACVAALLTQPNEDDDFMPCDAVVELAGTALAISAQELMRVCRQSRQAHQLLERYAQASFHIWSAERTHVSGVSLTRHHQPCRPGAG